MEWLALVAALGGGAFGAALGAVPVFILTGIVALVGVASAMQGNPALLQAAFGPVLGPQSRLEARSRPPHMPAPAR